MRRLVLAGWLGCLGCTGCSTGPTPDLALDMGSSCKAIDLEVRDDPVLPGWDVHALAVERRDGDRVWALATDGKGRLRLRAWPDGPDHDLSGLGEPADFRLLPGPVEGQTWLVLDRPGLAQLWRVEDSDEGALVAGPVLASPADEPVKWRLLFLGEEPHLAAIPVSADASTMEMTIARLDDETLAPESAWTLPLWTPCDASYCNNTALTGPVDIDPIAVTEGGLLGGAWMMIGVYGARTNEPPVSHTVYMTRLLLVQLRSRGPDQAPAMGKIESFYPPSSSPTMLDPAFIASDASGFYWLAGLSTVEPGPAAGSDLLFRLGSGRGGTSEAIASAKRELRSHLLQIGGRAALGQIPGNTWTIAPLGEDGVNTDLIAKLVIEPDAEISSAGRGEFLVRGGGRARRVAAVCAADPQNE